MKVSGVVLALVLAGCCSGHVRQEPVRPLARIVLARHDAYVSRDASLSAERKARRLRSSALLRRVLGVAAVGSR